MYVQSSAGRRFPGLVKFFPAVAYHLCLALPAAFTQHGEHLLAEPCIDDLFLYKKCWKLSHFNLAHLLLLQFEVEMHALLNLKLQSYSSPSSDDPSGVLAGVLAGV